MTITILNTVDAKEQFTDLVNRVAHSKERVILTRRGKEIAAIISLDDLKILQESQEGLDLKEAIEALKEARLVGAMNLEQFKDEVGL